MKAKGSCRFPKNIKGNVLTSVNLSSQLPPTIIHLHRTPLRPLVSQRPDIPAATHTMVITWSIALSNTDSLLCITLRAVRKVSCM